MISCVFSSAVISGSGSNLDGDWMTTKRTEKRALFSDSTALFLGPLMIIDEAQKMGHRVVCLFACLSAVVIFHLPFVRLSLFSSAAKADEGRIFIH